LLKPAWLSEPLEELEEEPTEELALGTLAANFWLLELFEVRARAGLLERAAPERLPSLSPLSELLAEDLRHLGELSKPYSAGPRAWLSPLLREGLSRALAREAEVVEAFHVAILEPTLAALLSFLSARTSLPLTLRYAPEEAEHSAKALEALRRPYVAGLEEAMVKFLEENTLLLFASAFAEEGGRSSLLRLLGCATTGEEASGALAELYAQIDAARASACKSLFGPSSGVVTLVSEYGLAKRGLC